MKERDVSVWVPPALDMIVRRPKRALPFPLDDPSTVLLSLGRHALWHGIRAIGLRPGDEVLVPAFNHGSEVEVFARVGVRCRFFDATDLLEPDPTELERLLTPNVKALHLIHYLGFPQDSGRWRRWCDERGVALIEDAAQAWLARRDDRPIGSWGDVAIFCLYKTYGLPDGAAFVCRERPVLMPSRRRLGFKQVLKRELSLRRIVRPGGSGEAPQPFALGDPYRRPARVTSYLVPRVATDATADLRRNNYAYLLERLGEITPAPFDSLDPGASPFAFPIVTHRKNDVVAELRRNDIRAESFWSKPHPLVPPGFPGAERRREITVALPVHQEVTTAQMEAAVRIVRRLVA